MEDSVVAVVVLVAVALVEDGKMHLNDNEKNEISKEIESLEEQSSAELVAVITKQSSSYRFETILVSILFTILISILILIIENISPIKMFQWQIMSFVLVYFILYKFETILFKLLPKTYKYEKTSTYANKQFSNLGLQTTKTKQAIMFFVSIDEKYVEIITDSAIKEKIDNSYWQDIVNEFIKDVKKDKLANGYLKAIKSCNKILIKEFPIKDDDENELSNEVIELK